jgi:flap endonuclease-1
MISISIIEIDLMGVRKLNKFLIERDLIIEHADLKKYIDSIKQNPSTNNCKSGRIVIAIDFWLYVHKFLHSNKSTNIAMAFLNQIIKIMGAGAVPIYVADGHVPIEKEDEHIHRMNVRNKKLEEIQNLELQMIQISDEDTEDLFQRVNRLEKQVKRASRDEIKDILNIFEIMGIPFVRARYEADALCTLLYREGVITACLSDDMDMLALGCGSTIRIEKGRIIEYDLSFILKKLDLNREQFIDLCIIFGSGYLKHPIRVDPTSAYEMIHRSGSLLDAMFSGDYPEFNVESRNILVIGENYHDVVDIYLESPDRETVDIEIDTHRLNIPHIIAYLRKSHWFNSSSKNIRHMKYDLYRISRTLYTDQFEEYIYETQSEE